MRRILVAALIFALISAPALSEELCPKYGSCVPAEKFVCQDITRSSLITRLCYSAEKSYMILRLKKTDYQYCSIDAATVDEFLKSESMGRFYNSRIKVRSNDGLYDCRKHPVPTF